MADDTRESPLGTSDLDLAFRHGFAARDRFADRPFDEVESYLRSSWEGMQPPAAWERVRDVVRSGYEEHQGASVAESTELPDEALDHFPERTQGGSRVEGRQPHDELAYSMPTEERPAGGTGPLQAGADELPEADLTEEDER